MPPAWTHCGMNHKAVSLMARGRSCIRWWSVATGAGSTRISPRGTRRTGCGRRWTRAWHCTARCGPATAVTRESHARRGECSESRGSRRSLRRLRVRRVGPDRKRQDDRDLVGCRLPTGQDRRDERKMIQLPRAVGAAQRKAIHGTTHWEPVKRFRMELCGDAGKAFGAGAD